MGGPYICTIHIGDKFIADDCLFDDFILKDENKLFFVKCHFDKQRGWYFTINYYSFTEDCIYEYLKGFYILYIKQFVSDNELEIYHAFHDKIEKYKDFFNLDKVATRRVEIGSPRIGYLDTRT